MFLLILFTPFKDEEDFVIDEIITALCERQIDCLLGKYIVNNTLYRFCRGYFRHRCPFVRLMKNVTYATHLVAQINVQKCMLQ